VRETIVSKENNREQSQVRRLFYACFEDLTREAAWTVHIREVVDNWQALGTSVTLFAPGIWPFSVPPACEVVYVPTINVRIIREYLFLMIVPLYVLFFGLKRRPAAVYCREMSFMLPIVWATRLLGIPVVMEINGFLLKDLEMIGASGLRLSVFRLFQRINLRLSDGLVFAGRDYLDLFRREYPIEKGKAYFIPNGVDTDLFSPGDGAQAARLAGLDVNRRYVTFVGTFYPHSLTPVIVRAAQNIVAKYPDVDFIMVGDGHDLARCKEAAGELGISDRIVFVGTKMNRDVPAYLRASKVLINLVDGSDDSGSMKLLEYMSSGGAVVVNSGAAFGVVLTHRLNCYLIDQAEPETLAQAIETLLNDDGLRRRIGKNARAFILSRFSWNSTAQRLLSVIDEVRARG
jgi:glycosyltransferase involved in cell wall biosynthesis